MSRHMSVSVGVASPTRATFSPTRASFSSPPPEFAATLSSLPFNARPLRRFLSSGAIIIACIILLSTPSASRRLSPLLRVPSLLASHRHPSAIHGRNTTFTKYLDDRWPGYGKPGEPHLWITMADSGTLEGGTSALQTFVTKLNGERAPLRETVVVVLCIDIMCVEKCKPRGFNCFGGFQFSRPAEHLAKTCCDPYPIMEPRIFSFDIVAQDNNDLRHINTGWMWLRKDPRTVAAWREVLRMDMLETSRDQVLDTAERRLWNDPLQLPPRTNFLSPTGLRVNVLEHSFARSYHFEIDAAHVQRHQSLFLHMTCGDNQPIKDYVSKSQGYWGDVNGYYSDPPQLLSTNHLVGSVRDLTKLVQILLAIAHYTGRAFMPPSTVVFADLLTESATPTIKVPSGQIVRQVYSAFPFAHLGAALGVDIVEPDYTEHAVRHLAGATTSLADVEEGNSTVSQHYSPGSEELQKIQSLLDVAVLDVRQIRTSGDLVKTLLEPSFANRKSIQIINFDWPTVDGTPPWLEWALPPVVEGVAPCAELERLPSCGQICRWPENGPGKVIVQGEWPVVDWSQV